MERLNKVMEKFEPHFTSFLQLLVICVESFIVNVYVSVKCVYLYLNKYSLKDFSIQNYNQIINDEIQKQNNPLLLNIGVWISMIFCFEIMWIIVENLTFPIIKTTLWWFLCWSVGLYLKNKIGDKFLSKIKKA